MTSSLTRGSWDVEIGYAEQITAPFDCVVSRSHHAYEIATIKGDGVSLLLCPHKVKSTANVHVRSRDNGSKNKKLAREILLALYNGVGLPEETKWKVSTFCTFYCKSLP